MARRPLNKCGRCNDTWHPRGRSLSNKCPNCGSKDVGIVPLIPLIGDGCVKFILASTILLFAIPAACNVCSGPMSIGTSNAPNYVNVKKSNDAYVASRKKKGRRKGKRKLTNAAKEKCAKIKPKLNYAVKMNQKDPAKWAKWVVHWKGKANSEGCDF